MWKKSADILKKRLTEATHIAINLHRNPDPDSIGTARAFFEVLTNWGKKITIVTPTPVEKKLEFLLSSSMNIQPYSVSLFHDVDLFLILDASSWEMVTGDLLIKQPSVPFVAIDHHATHLLSKQEGSIVDPEATATGEIAYRIFSYWKEKITPSIATALFSSIAGDTGFFHYARNPVVTFQICHDLLAQGADINLYIEHQFMKYTSSFLKAMGSYLLALEINTTYKYSFIIMTYSDYKKFEVQAGVRETIADQYICSISDVEFGFVASEVKPGEVMVSFRSKGKVDVSKIALVLGGGGHHDSSGCLLKGEVSQIIEKIHLTIQKELIK